MTELQVVRAGTVPYEQAWARQREVHAARVAGDGPDLRPVTNGLALIPTSNGVHHDSEPQRRPMYHRLVADGTLPPGHATDDGVGLLYRGTELVEAVADRPGGAAHRVERGPDGTAVETRLEPRRLR